jgi:hypothetical protein
MESAMVRLLIAAAWIMVSETFGSYAVAADVNVQDVLQNARPVDGTIVIQTGADDVLVFQGAGKPIDLKGSSLIAKAARVRLEGISVIRSFTVDLLHGEPLPKIGIADRGTDRSTAGRCAKGNGCDGDAGGQGWTGAIGDSGKDAGKIVLDFGQIDGSGELIVASVGQRGGRGQTAGAGGRGGEGGRGADRACGLVDPGDGGNGGDGGIGGLGGKGGNGGSAGEILFTSTLLPSLIKKQIRLYSVGGLGGLGGQGGKGGDPGKNGEGGHGAGCLLGPGGGGHGGQSGRKGPEGEAGAEGSVGSALGISCSNCDPTKLDDKAKALISTYQNGQSAWPGLLWTDASQPQDWPSSRYHHPGIATVFPVPLAGFAECVNLLIVNMPDFDRVPLPQPNVLSFRTISGMPTPSAIFLGSLFPISPQPKRVCGSERLQLKAGFMRVSPSQNPQFAAIYWNKISPTIGPTEICEAYFDPWNCNLKQNAGPTAPQTVPR